MAIFKNYKIKKARELGNKLGRKGMSDEVEKAVNDFDGSPKGVMELAGKLVFWADVSTCDDYWQEQVERGLSKAVHRACDLSEKFGISPESN